VVARFTRPGGATLRRTLRLAIGVLAALLACAMALPAHSRAASVPGPAYFSTGLADDPAFVQSSQAVRSVWLARARQVGSTTARIGIVWSVVAPYTRPRVFDAANPGDPHYN
jgi:hypothetical protein